MIPKGWALLGAATGLAAGLVAFAPAAWLAAGVRQASLGQVLLSDARGTVWAGSAVAVLAGGRDSQDAMALPGRLEWRLGLGGGGLVLRARQACCLHGEPQLRVAPGWSEWKLELQPEPGSDVIGHWPAAWLAGLGTPWNTMQLGGELRLSSPGLVAEGAPGRWVMRGDAVVDFQRMASRLSTLPVLGSYRLQLTNANAPRLTLQTTEGALRLSGQGDWNTGRLRFNGEASAAPGSEAALANLLNIIGRRQGARSLIQIGAIG
jgi:general secretion pathway protein N